jgi:predicted esterase
MSETLKKGTSSFSIDVPYLLKETGSETRKPLIIYLHGFKQNIEYFEKKVEKMMRLNAYHLFIQAPYPVYDTTRKLEVARWGRAWYLYDGDQNQFIESMERASVFINEVLDSVSGELPISRVCIFGYSMGAYLGGYFALSRPDTINELITIGGRIKTEAFEGKREKANHIRVLALHGENDSSVYPEPQKKCVEQLLRDGFKAEFRLVDAGHKLESVFVHESIDWLRSIGYSER